MAAVTVVITSYNQGPLIHEAVESALAQTVRPELIIIVDDGSDDHASVEMLNATLDDRRHGTMDTNGVAIDLIGQANAGPSAARNRGTAAAFVSHNCYPATCIIRRAAWERCGGYDESMRGDTTPPPVKPS